MITRFEPTDAWTFEDSRKLYTEILGEFHGVKSHYDSPLTKARLSLGSVMGIRAYICDIRPDMSKEDIEDLGVCIADLFGISLLGHLREESRQVMADAGLSDMERCKVDYPAFKKAYESTLEYKVPFLQCNILEYLSHFRNTGVTAYGRLDNSLRL